MKGIRNRYFRRELIAYAILLAVLTAAGFYLSEACGFLCLGGSLLFCLLHLYYTGKRYANIAELSQELDRVLHGQQEVLIESHEEGELSILQSEIHKMTLRLKEQTDQLQQDKRYLADAIADIFHQLRTPLTAMNLAVSLLSKEDLSYERRLYLTHELKRQLERVHWLTETLLKMSQMDAGTITFEAKPIPVPALLLKVTAPFDVAMELREQKLVIEAEDMTLSGDEVWLTEALGNLVKNCMEHTPAGGEIRITARENAVYSEILIEDTGSGFEKEDIPHLFERFYKGKNAGSSSVGIGLALSRMIIQGQNGTLSAKNAPAGGALFTARFYKSVV